MTNRTDFRLLLHRAGVIVFPGTLILALACTAMLFGLDIYLYTSGLSWTPLHYESLAPLTAIGVTNRFAKPSAIAATILFSTITVLFFIFGLTYRLSSESPIFLVLTLVSFVAWSGPQFLHIRQPRKWPWFFLAAVLATIITDKLISNDKFASSYLPHFLKISTNSANSQSNNPVYASIRESLVAGEGNVLIVFEALGIPKDHSIVASLVRRHPGFKIESVHFEGGSTVPAEVRYICGKNGDISDFANCLPRLTKSMAMHGNSLAYFNRELLYKQMGFITTQGRHELTGLPTCTYAYTAICDRALWGHLLSVLKDTGCREFYYLLTIDSHFPYAKYQQHDRGLYSDLDQLLTAIEAGKAGYPKCRFTIAGDHPPPLASEFEADQILLIHTTP